MAIVSIMPAGAAGIITDRPPAELQPQVWSKGENARFVRGGVSPMLSDLSLLTSPGWQAYMAIPVPDSGTNQAQWLLLGATAAKCYTNNALTDVTRLAGAYTGQASDRWSGCALSGVIIANNGVDVPQAWLTPDTATKLVDLANWPSTVRAKCIRSFKQFLVALDITKDVTRYPTLVKWSHPADPGVVPASWDETDPTKDAGETPLSETMGAVVDCVSLRDINVIYKTDSVWGMQYVGGAFVFRFYKIFGDWGMPVRDCAVEFMAGRHFVFTGSDLVVHDGTTVKSVASGRMRDYIRRISSSRLQTCYTVLHTEREEVWFCFREAEDALLAADTAVVYNWVEETLTIRALNDYRFIAVGRLDTVPTAGTTWVTSGDQWVERTTFWGSGALLPASRRLLGLGTERLVGVDQSDQPAQTMYVEREQIGVQMRATAPPDMSAMKFLSRIWPRISGTPGELVQVQLGASQGIGEATVWEPKQTFILGTTKKLDCTLAGRLFSIRVESEGTHVWTLSGLDAEVKMLGNN